MHDGTVTTVAVCEDDEAVRRLLADLLRMNGYEVVVAHNGHQALSLFGHPDAADLVIIDIGLPDADGRDVCQSLRARGVDAPVLFLTALDAVHDKVSGLRAGADDYMVKPFAISEVLARLEALERRLRPRTRAPGGLDLDATSMTLNVGERSVRLTPTEFRLLAAIAAGAGQVVRRRKAVAAAWPDGAVVHENTVDSYIRRLRVKLNEVAAPVELRTVRGVGFVLE